MRLAAGRRPHTYTERSHIFSLLQNKDNMTTDKKVTFNEIEILEFQYILGDNPAVSSGAPIALGNDLVRQLMYEVDFYENNRGKRKSRKKLVIPVQTRAQM